MPRGFHVEFAERHFFFYQRTTAVFRSKLFSQALFVKCPIDPWQTDRGMQQPIHLCTLNAVLNNSLPKWSVTKLVS